jgi:hypothetical protein
LDVGLGREKEFVGREREGKRHEVWRSGERQQGRWEGPAWDEGWLQHSAAPTDARVFLSFLLFFLLFVIPSVFPSFLLSFLSFPPSFSPPSLPPFPSLPFLSFPFLSLFPLRHLKIHPWGFSLGWGVSAPMEGSDLHSTEPVDARVLLSFLPPFLLSFLPSFLPLLLPSSSFLLPPSFLH